VKKRYKTLRSIFAISSAAAFALFLTASAPHRVHHLLENLAPPPAENSQAKGDRLRADLSQGAPYKQAFAPLAECHRHVHRDQITHDHCPAHKTPQTARAQTAPPDDFAGQPDAPPSPFPSHANRPKRDAQHDRPAQSDCIMQAAAQHAHALPIGGFHVNCIATQSTGRSHHQQIRPIGYNPAPFSQRAPPRL
jgi:hypothetical protein